MADIRIKLIMPVLGDFNHGLNNYLNRVKDPGTDLTLVKVEGGVASIEGAYDTALAGPYILKEVKSAESEGFHALTILCGNDPVLQAAKEVSNIPVVGILEAAIHIACVLGRRFSMLTILPQTVGNKYEKLGEMGITARCSSVISLGIPALELHQDRERTISVLTEKSKIAVERDQADTIIVTCIGMFDVIDELSRRVDIPILEPMACGIKWCEMLSRMELSQSKRAFPTPREKKRSVPGLKGF